ncbi:hypothetical protein KQI42_14920 [Tissierella sp. MSJ-40]|uniref:Phage protein n=1 Tax=Tissierella simiarum TaxID=2841534 RepID=A0ABS6EAT8_9FIRM|nr:hypothetical protein [Tissierella simiarum]MBU5439314.1 hypothetical protein [Tissierella simiarum]
MNYLFYEKETDTRAKVMLIYYTEPPQELMDRGNYIMVENLIEPNVIEGKTSLPYCNPQTGEFWYEYVDRPLAEEEINSKKLNELEGTIMELTTIIAQLQGGN